MNSLYRTPVTLTLRSLQMIQRRNRLILGDSYKDGFKEIPDHGYAPKHKKAYADITTPTPNHRGTVDQNKFFFQISAIVFASIMGWMYAVRPTIRQVQFYKEHRFLHEADERYVDYLRNYYYDEINKIIDDEAVIAGSAVKRVNVSKQ